MEYRFKSNKTCSELSEDLSSVLFKDRFTASHSVWKRGNEKIFYGIVKNKNFTIKRLSSNNKIAPPCFTGKIVENGNEVIIVGRFNFNFMINYFLYFAFLLFTIFFFFMRWNHRHTFSFIVFEIIALIVYVFPMEYIRNKEEEKILKLINEVI